MSQTLQKNIDDLIPPDQPLILKYEGEDDQSLLVTSPDGTRLNFPKNRSIPQPLVDKPPKPLTPAFRLLALAFVGLAPAGLGALILAPLAVLWAVAVPITRPLKPGDKKRVIVVCGIAVLLLGMAIPMSALFIARLSS
jgi:hypothetical protein